MLDWSKYIATAKKFQHKAKAQDREDLNHTIIVSLADAQIRLDIRHDIILELHRARQRDGKPLPLLRAYRIASLTVALYWRRLKRQLTTLSLNTELEDGEGNITELMDTVADDSIDLEAWLDEATWRLGCPQRLVEVVRKRLYGIPLNHNDQMYLNRFRHKEQKRLF